MNFLQYCCFCFMLVFYFFGWETYGIFAMQPGIEPTTPALEGEVLTIELPEKSLSQPTERIPQETHPTAPASIPLYFLSLHQRLRKLVVCSGVLLSQIKSGLCWRSRGRRMDVRPVQPQRARRVKASVSFTSLGTYLPTPSQETAACTCS